MAILNAVVIASKEGKGGRNKVRISVAHNGETRYIVTDIILNSSKEFKGGLVVKRPDANILNLKIRGLLEHYQSVIDDLEYIDGLSCPELVFQLKNARATKHRTLASIFEEYMGNAKVSPNTIKRYNSLWNGIKEYMGEARLAAHVTLPSVLGFEAHLRKKQLSSTTIRNYITFLMVLLGYARRCGYINYKADPFMGYKMPPAEIRQAWLTPDEIKRIRDLEVTKSNLVKCRDFFMLSYYLGGINMVDLININFNEQKDVIRYVRKKTENLPKLNKYVEFTIPNEAKEIIARMKGPSGYIEITKRKRKIHVQEFLNWNLKQIGKLVGIDKLIYYSARKSFSQHAFDLGINTSVIDYILGHRVDKGGASLYHYISVTPKLASEAVRKVLDNLK